MSPSCCDSLLKNNNLCFFHDSTAGAPFACATSPHLIDAGIADMYPAITVYVLFACMLFIILLGLKYFYRAVGTLCIYGEDPPPFNLKK